MRVILLFIVVFNMVSMAENSLPEGWPWKGVDTMAYVVESDPEALQFIIDNNIKYVRIHFFKKKIMRDYNVSGEQALELNLKWAKIINDKLTFHGIRSFITLADFPVSLSKCINKKKSGYWNDKACVEQIYHDVNKTVSFFKNSNILGYEFFGEPVVVKNGKGMRPDNWDNIFKNIIKITRKIDNNKWLFYSPGPSGSPINYNAIIPFQDDKIIYNAHMYFPHAYTHQGIKKRKKVLKYPGTIVNDYWNKDRLKKILMPLRNFQLRYNKPVSISEFSTALWAEGSDEYISDLIEIFNNYNWGWMYFNIGSNYRGWDARFDAVLDSKYTIFNKFYIKKPSHPKFIYKGIQSNRFQTIKPFLQFNSNIDSIRSTNGNQIFKDNNETSNNRK